LPLIVPSGEKSLSPKSLKIPSDRAINELGGGENLRGQ